MKVKNVTLIFAEKPIHCVSVRPHGIVRETSVIRWWLLLVKTRLLVIIAPLAHRYSFLHNFIVRGKICMRETKVAVYRFKHLCRGTRHLFFVLLIESVRIVPFWSKPKRQKPHVALQFQSIELKLWNWDFLDDSIVFIDTQRGWDIVAFVFYFDGAVACNSLDCIFRSNNF